MRKALKWLVRAVWLLCAISAIAHAFWIRKNGGNVGDSTTAVFWQLMLLGFPGSFIAYFVSWAFLLAMSALAGRSNIAEWQADGFWLFLHVVTAAVGYWQWFVYLPNAERGGTRSKGRMNPPAS